MPAWDSHSKENLVRQKAIDAKLFKFIEENLIDNKRKGFILAILKSRFASANSNRRMTARLMAKIRRNSKSV